MGVEELFEEMGEGVAKQAWTNGGGAGKRGEEGVGQG